MFQKQFYGNLLQYIFNSLFYILYIWFFYHSKCKHNAYPKIRLIKYKLLLLILLQKLDLPKNKIIIFKNTKYTEYNTLFTFGKFRFTQLFFIYNKRLLLVFFINFTGIIKGFPLKKYFVYSYKNSLYWL